METIYESDIVKIEKAKAMRRYRTFQKIGNIIRTLEVFIAIAVISFSVSWTSSCIPTVLQFSGGIFRRLTSVLFSPHFVFVIGNVIVITLFAKSSPPSENTDNFSSENDVIEADVAVMTEKREPVEKFYRRSQSTAIVEVAKAAEEVTEKKELRRSTTVPRRKNGSDEVAVKAKAANRCCNEDELSDVEFNRRVEEFIEKQRKFLSEESTILVLSK